MTESGGAWFTNDAVVLGILLTVLALIFGTAASPHPFWKRFYQVVPALLLCYFIPGILNSLGVIDGAQSQLYFVASRYLLPSSLILLTLSIDLPEVLRLGYKAVLVFLAGTVGVIIGGPLAILLVSLVAPNLVGGIGPEAVWRGMATIAGSWIGGGANQTAMKEVFGASDVLFSKMIAVDVIVANVWMACLLFGATRSVRMDRLLGADAAIVDRVRDKMEQYRLQVEQIPSLRHTMWILGVGFGGTALAHVVADTVAPLIALHAPSLARFSLTSGFFWIVVTATTLGLILSFSPLRQLAGVGASRLGTAMLYVLVASIGMKMDILAIFAAPGLFVVGFIWIAFHVSCLLIAAKLLRAPFFFVAVGSQANIGGAASAPIVAAAFHPSLAPVGVLLAVLGYALGTYGAWLCGVLMQLASF